MARQAPLGARPNWDVAPWFSKGDARQGFTGPRRPGRSREPSSNGRSRGMIVASAARWAAQNPAYRPSDPFSSPSPNPLPLKGARALFPSPRHCERSEATQGSDTDRCRCSPGLLRRYPPRNDAEKDLSIPHIPCSPRRRGSRPFHTTGSFVAHPSPTPNPLPRKGGKGFVSLMRHCERSEATQGSDMGLWGFPLPRLRRYFPQRGTICASMIFPLWGKWRVATKGALFSLAHPKPPKFHPQCHSVSLYPNSSRVNPVQSSR